MDAEPPPALRVKPRREARGKGGYACRRCGQVGTIGSQTVHVPPGELRPKTLTAGRLRPLAMGLGPDGFRR